MSGSIKPLGPRKWVVRYDVFSPTKRERRSERLEGVTRKEAEAYLAQRRAELVSARKAHESGHIVKDEMRLADLFAEFMLAKTTKAETTVKRYESIIRLYLTPQFGGMVAGSLRPYHLTDAYAEWMTNGRRVGDEANMISARTVRHVHETMRNVLSWGVRREVLSRNVAALISEDDLPKAIKPKPKALTDAEVRKLLAEAKSPPSRSKKRGYLSAQPWFYPAVMFSVYTGARRGETLALQWNDVDFERSIVTISRSVTQTLNFKAPKNDRERTITMSDNLMEVLRDHRASQARERELLGAGYKDSNLVFALADGSVVTPWNYGAAVRDLIRRAGVSNITLHGLRDTHASLLAAAGVPIEVVSKRLGHADISITCARYLDVYVSRDANAAEAFDRLVG